jgi:hypothetical protein
MHLVDRRADDCEVKAIDRADIAVENLADVEPEVDDDNWLPCPCSKARDQALAADPVDHSSAVAGAGAMAEATIGRSVLTHPLFGKGTERPCSWRQSSGDRSAEGVQGN